MSPKEDILKRTPLFANLALAEIHEVAETLIEKRYSVGEMLFWEGEPCEGLFLLAAGTVKIFKTSRSGREMTIALENAPATVAELPLFDGGPYPASARAAVDVVAYFIHKADFHQLCRRFPDVSLKILKSVGRRLRHLVQTLESITFGSVTQRLARLLLDERDRAGSDEFPLPGTHQELASRLSTVREVVSRNLARFRADGLIRTQGANVVIVDRAGLQREAETEL